MKTSVIVGFGMFAVVMIYAIYAAFIGGGIYFIFWCLQHFGIIGG